MVRVGEMRDRVEVQSLAETRSAQGGFINTFSTDDTWWAKINPISALERVQGDQAKAVRSHRITMRFYDPGLDETMRIKFGTRIFNIVAVVNPGERGINTIIDVKEDLNNGL